MITTTQMYWLTRCTAISTTGQVLAVLSGIALGIATIVSFAVSALEDDDSVKQLSKRSLAWIVSIFTVSLAVSVLVPSTKEMAAIYVVPKIVNSECIQESAKNLIELANDWMLELKPKKHDKN